MKHFSIKTVFLLPILSAICILLGAGSITAHAETALSQDKFSVFDDPEKTYLGYMEGWGEVDKINGFFNKWGMENVYNNIVEQSINAMNLGHSMSEIFSSSSTDSGNAVFNFSKIQEGLLKSVEDFVIKPITSLALSILFVFFIISLLELVIQDRMTPEHFMRAFTRLILYSVLLMYIGTSGTGDNEHVGIYRGILNFGDSISAWVGELSANIGQDVLDEPAVPEGEEDGVATYGILGNSFAVLGSNLVKNIEDQGSFAGLGYWLKTNATMTLALAISLVLLGICYFVQFSRIFELTIRGAFLPIAIALMADDGWRGAGGRYIRKFLAVASQGMVLIMIGNITTGVMRTVATMNATGNIGNTTGIVINLGVSVACVSMMFKSINFVNDIWGA